MRTLTRYIGREVLGAILLIFMALIMLFAFFDLIAELGNVGKADYTITTALLFVNRDTATLSVAKAGRAAYVNAGNLTGHVDPGAEAVARLFEALSTS